MVSLKKLNFLLIFVIPHVIFDKIVSTSIKVENVFNSASISAAATAIDDFIQEFYLKRKVDFEIIIFGRETSLYTDILDEISRRNGGRYYTSVKKYPDLLGWNEYFDKSAIVFIKNQELLYLNYKALFYNDFYKDLKFLFYCNDCSEFPMAKVNKMSFVNKFIDQFQYFLIDFNNDVLHFLTYDWWGNDNCNKFFISHLNVFHKTTMKWEKPFEYVEKFTNFHNCLITCSVFSDDKPYYDAIDGKLKSYMGDIFDIVAQMLNFTPYLTPNSFLEYTDNTTIQADVMLDLIFLCTYELQNRHLGGTIADVALTFVISPGELYTSYEKVLLPFDEQTWWFLIATFAGAFSIIFIINLLPKRMRDVINGKDVRVPAFNVIGTFFGIGQLKLPGNNFARIILITFIFFCLVIRTAYQGVQFDMMTKEMRRKPAQSMQQLFDENYTIWIIDDSKVDGLENWMEDETLRSAQKIDEHLETNLMRFCSLSSSVKEAFLLEDYEVDQLIAKCPNKPEVLDEVYMTVSVGIATSRNHFLMPALMKVMHLTTPFGIPQYHYKLYYEDKYRLRPRNDDSDPKVLFFGDLSFGFVIWLAACGVSFCGLLSELVVKFFSIKVIPAIQDHLSKRSITKLIQSKNILLVQHDSVVNINEVKRKKSKKAKKVVTETIINIEDEIDAPANDSIVEINRNQEAAIDISRSIRSENEINENKNVVIEIESFQNETKQINSEIKKDNVQTDNIQKNHKPSGKKTVLDILESPKKASVEIIEKDEKLKTEAINCEINQEKVSKKTEEAKAEVDEIKNLIQDFESEIEKPRKVQSDEEILDVSLNFVSNV